MKVSSRACPVLVLRLAAWAATGILVVVPAAAGAAYVAANFTTNSYIVLLPPGQGIGSGRVRGGPGQSVVPLNMLSLQFNLVAGPGFAAGAVTATTDAEGRVTKLAKGNEKCTVFYHQTGAASRVDTVQDEGDRARHPGRIYRCRSC
jgi:hypothetical protein